MDNKRKEKSLKLLKKYIYIFKMSVTSCIAYQKKKEKKMYIN